MQLYSPLLRKKKKKGIRDSSLKRDKSSFRRWWGAPIHVGGAGRRGSLCRFDTLDFGGLPGTSGCLPLHQRLHCRQECRAFLRQLSRARVGFTDRITLPHETAMEHMVERGRVGEGGWARAGERVSEWGWARAGGRGRVSEGELIKEKKYINVYNSKFSKQKSTKSGRCLLVTHNFPSGNGSLQTKH